MRPLTTLGGGLPQAVVRAALRLVRDLVRFAPGGALPQNLDEARNLTLEQWLNSSPVERAVNTNGWLQPAPVHPMPHDQCVVCAWAIHTGLGAPPLPPARSLASAGISVGSEGTPLHAQPAVAPDDPVAGNEQRHLVGGAAPWRSAVVDRFAWTAGDSGKGVVFCG